MHLSTRTLGEAVPGRSRDTAVGGAARLVVHDLAHRFPGTDVLFEDLSFTAGPGEVLAVCGPSGCGKSTLLALVAGWIRPTSGRVEMRGVDRVGWVFQNPHGVARRTALDHVVLPLLAHGHPRRTAETRAGEILGDFHLADAADRQFRRLSGGEAQRLMLARAVAAAPGLLLVDEPTAQLDLHTAATVNRVLDAVAGRDTIVLIATHDPATRAACTRVIDLTRAAPGGEEPDPGSSTAPSDAEGGPRDGTVTEERTRVPAAPSDADEEHRG